MVGNRTHDLQISVTLSHVSPKCLTFFAPDITDDISGLVYRIGFLGLLSLFKEVNELNTKYTAKRWDAFKAAAKFELGPWDASFLSGSKQSFIGLSSTSVKTQHLIGMRKRFNGPGSQKIILKTLPTASKPCNGM
ncbi:hypothetical protein ElyMa_004434400 [Elysia marginata]|uniref:Uncharacterized protein n=1 Tax=Elysia marginata TaxID=1093978 RepID=A0AAV4HDZ1_9GAST|nr:hypothetical protein ElyMa_004434400 [Elysia marginata]